MVSLRKVVIPALAASALTALLCLSHQQGNRQIRVLREASKAGIRKVIVGKDTLKVPSELPPLDNIVVLSKDPNGTYFYFINGENPFGKNALDGYTSPEEEYGGLFGGPPIPDEAKEKFSRMVYALEDSLKEVERRKRLQDLDRSSVYGVNRPFYNSDR